MSLFRTRADKHRELCYPYMLHNYNEAVADCRKLQDRINKQEASVKANRMMYQIAEKVVREQAEEIKLLKVYVETLEDRIDRYEDGPW